MACDLSIHGVLGVRWRPVRRLKSGLWTADLVVYSTDANRPVEVTMFAPTEMALRLCGEEEVAHVG